MGGEQDLPHSQWTRVLISAPRWGVWVSTLYICMSTWLCWIDGWLATRLSCNVLHNSLGEIGPSPFTADLLWCGNGVEPCNGFDVDAGTTQNMHSQYVFNSEWCQVSLMYSCLHVPCHAFPSVWIIQWLPGTKGVSSCCRQWEGMQLT